MTEFRIISLPAFQAACSAVSNNFDFSQTGVLGKFDAYFSAIKVPDRDNFCPRDFLYFDEGQQGLVWIWALAEGMPDGGNKLIDFEGGYYLTYAYKDGDEEANGDLYRKAMKYIEDSSIFQLDIRPNHYAMGHIITPQEIIDRQG